MDALILLRTLGALAAVLALLAGALAMLLCWNFPQEPICSRHEEPKGRAVIRCVCRRGKRL